MIWIFAVIVAVWAGWLDWRSRRIPNWLTVSGFLIGLALNTAVWGWQGTQIALAGVVAGAIAVGQMIRQRRVRKTLANLWDLVRGFFIFGLRPHPELSLENPAAMTFPFGVAVAAATLLCYGVAAVGL